MRITKDPIGISQPYGDIIMSPENDLTFTKYLVSLSFSINLDPLHTFLCIVAIPGRCKNKKSRKGFSYFYLSTPRLQTIFKNKALITNLHLHSLEGMP